jgi:hypothetical protein
VTATTILRSSLNPLDQHLRFVFLDILWRCIWLICSLFAAALLGVAVVAQLGSVEWMGPDLGGPSPIMLVTALREFWKAYGATLLAEFGLLFLSVLAFWVVLEALFRGGRKEFWVFLGTSVARISLLGSTAAVFVLLALRDETGGTFLIGAIVLLGLWFLVSVLETAIRKDALTVMAVEFPKLLLVFGALIGTEMVLAFVLWGSALAALALASPSSAGGMALVILGVVAPFWLVLHSYLVAVRFSAIDIMSGCDPGAREA